ncbi:MAG: hypothetical protein JO323_11605 [Acidobacteriia bacterium]|nr:hypothetical protein [Terriglobia bacterium]
MAEKTKILKFGQDYNDSAFQVNERGEIVNSKGEVILSHASVIGVNLNARLIQAMDAPADAPALEATEKLSAVSKDAISNHLDRCKTDVKKWDPIRTQMTVLANQLKGFCSDSLTALEELVTTSQKLKSFDALADAERNDIRQEMQEIFQDLLRHAERNKQSAQDLAGDLGVFSDLVDSDKRATDNLRNRYGDYIKDEEKRIRKFELEKGMNPTEDLLKDFQDKIAALSKQIQDKEAAQIAAATVAGSMGAVSVNPLFWIFSIPGVIAGGVASGILGNELKDLKAELEPLITELSRAERLRSLSIWFQTNEKFFTDLAQALTQVKDHVNSLRGAWQEIANELTILSSETGRLKDLRAAAEDWQKPISKFQKRTTREAYLRIQDLASYFQKVAYVDQMKQAA